MVHAFLKSLVFGESVDDGLVGGVGLAGCGKTIVARWKFNGLHVWDNRVPPSILLDQSIIQVARMAGAERMDLRYSEECGEFHSGGRAFLRLLA